MRRVALAGIEGEFRRLWSEAGAAARESGEPVLRASTVNLVTVTDGPGALSEVTRILAEVAASVPGRMIVVAPDRLAPDGLEAWPSIQCRVPGAARSRPGGTQVVCCEQVVLDVRGTAVGELPALVRPLLETDLPSVLWWRAPVPAEASVLDRLAAEVGTVIVDTGRGAVWGDGVTRGGDPIAAVAGLLARRSGDRRDAAGRRGRRWTMRDLAFARLTPWRELTAALFDLVACQEMLRRVRSVTIAGRPEAPEGRLYLGWLASRLGWRPTGPGAPTARTYERREGGRLTVRTAPVEGTALARVAFEGPGVRAWVHLGETTPAGDLLEATAEVEGGAPVSQVATAEPMTEARLIGGELTMSGDDRVYEAAVQAVIR